MIAGLGIATSAVGGIVLARLVGRYIADVRIPGEWPIMGAAAILIASAVLAALCVSLAALPTPARAQDVINKEAAAELKASFHGDIETMRTKFLGLADAFPQDKYAWRPMDGVRSVSEVLMLAVTAARSESGCRTYLRTWRW